MLFQSPSKKLQFSVYRIGDFHLKLKGQVRKGYKGFPQCLKEFFRRIDNVNFFKIKMAVILFRFPLTHNGPFYRYGANEYVFAPYSSIIAL